MSNEPARSLYRSMGFQHVGLRRKYYQVGCCAKRANTMLPLLLCSAGMQSDVVLPSLPGASRSALLLARPPACVCRMEKMPPS